MKKECICSHLPQATSQAGNLVLRLTLAAVMWPHGAQKVLGWFGGGGFSATYETFTEKMGIAWPLALAAILTEFCAPFFLVAGFLTRLASLFLAITMTVAMTYNWQNGFFMNWYGNQKGEGVEYQILYVGAALALFLIGAGKYSIDHLAMKKYCSREARED